jgi:hypothetical protein
MCLQGKTNLQNTLPRNLPCRIFGNPDRRKYPSTPETSLSRLSKVSIGARNEAENACLMSGDHMNNRFLELEQVAIWVRQPEENEFAGQTIT